MYAGCRCALCVFPAVADIVSVAFTTVYVFALWTTTKRMMVAAINRRIQRRLRTFQIVTIAGELSPPIVRVYGLDLQVGCPLLYLGLQGVRFSFAGGLSPPIVRASEFMV